MKYIIATLIIILAAFLEVSFISAFPFVIRSIAFLFVILFSIYIVRKDVFSLYLLFIAGIFLDIFGGFQIGVTSANTCIVLLFYVFLSTLLPDARIGKWGGITASTCLYYALTYITPNIQAGKGLGGIWTLLPAALISCILVAIFTIVFEILVPVKRERKLILS